MRLLIVHTRSRSIKIGNHMLVHSLKIAKKSKILKKINVSTDLDYYIN